MEDAGVSGFDGASAVTRRRRSTTSRRSRPDNQFWLARYSLSSLSSTPSWEDASGQSPNGSSGRDSSVPRKEVNLNSLVPRASAINRNEGFTASKVAKKYVRSNGEYGESCNSAVSRPGSSASHARKKSLLELNQSSDKVPSTANWKSNNKRGEHSSVDVHIGSERNDANAWIVGNSEAPNGSAKNKLRKVKLKLGGVTRNVHAKSNMEGNADGGFSTKLQFPSDAPRDREKYIVLDNSNDHHSLKEKVDALQGAPWVDDEPQRMMASEPVRKSKRVPKRWVLDGASDDEDKDDEIRYLEKLKASKISSDHSAQHEIHGSEGTNKEKSSRVQKKASYEEEGDFPSSRRTTEHRKKSRQEMDSDDLDYIEEEEAESDVSEAMRKRQRKEPLDSLTDGRRKETSLTTRQRALQSAKDGSGGSSASLIEFPNGLPPAPPRKQKEKLSEVEQQLKKAEAAERRRMQVEKAARESEAEAIRKILGQDSSRKRREEKFQKKRDELAQEKAAKSLEQATNTVRWIMGPSGTTVTFPDGVDLSSIFNSKACGYPPAREKCAGPSCTNAYRYRDSKSNLPLCSLQCYRAVQQSAQLVKPC